MARRILRQVYITDEHRKAMAWRDGKNGCFKRTIKEKRQFDDKKPEELESQFDNFDVDNSYPTSPFKGRNIVDLDFMYCSTVTKVKINTWHLSQNTQDAYAEMHGSRMLIPSVQQIRIRSSCYNIICESE